MKDEYECGHCRATGWITLTGVYKQTLDLLRKQSQPIIPGSLAKIARCKHPAMCNRLAALEKLGFVMSERFGRTRRYVAKENYTGSFEVSP